MCLRTRTMPLAQRLTTISMLCGFAALNFAHRGGWRQRVSAVEAAVCVLTLATALLLMYRNRELR